MTRYERVPEYLKQAFREGHDYELIVADMLRAAGLEAIVSGLVVRRDDQNPAEFAHTKDVFVSRPGGTPAPIEIKSNRHAFTSPADWPFRIFVCYPVNKTVKNMPVLNISQKTGAVLGVLDYGEDRTVIWMNDHRPGRPGKYVYAAPNSSILTFAQWVDRAGEWLME